jgi:hypothetical protein
VMELHQLSFCWRFLIRLQGSSWEETPPFTYFRCTLPNNRRGDQNSYWHADSIPILNRLHHRGASDPGRIHKIISLHQARIPMVWYTRPAGGRLHSLRLGRKERRFPQCPRRRSPWRLRADRQHRLPPKLPT